MRLVRGRRAGERDRLVTGTCGAIRGVRGSQRGCAAVLRQTGWRREKGRSDSARLMAAADRCRAGLNDSDKPPSAVGLGSRRFSGTLIRIALPE